MSNCIRQYILPLILMSAVMLALSLPAHLHASFLDETRTKTEQVGLVKPFFKSSLGKITGAIHRFRSVLKSSSLLATPERRAYELEARRGILESVVKLIIDEIDQLILQFSDDSLVREELIGLLSENRLWFESILESIESAKTVNQLQTIASDVKQYRSYRHTVLVLKINKLILINRQERLINIAKHRLEKIESDLVVLQEQGADTSHLEELLVLADEKISEAMRFLDLAQEYILSIDLPYDERGDRQSIIESQNLISESNITIRDAYKIFIDMARIAGEL